MKKLYGVCISSVHLDILKVTEMHGIPVPAYLSCYYWHLMLCHNSLGLSDELGFNPELVAGIICNT